MKRVLTFLALMLLPLSVMAMTPVTDSTLSDVTGQAGVNINADLRMNIGIGTVAWGDADGVGVLTAYGWNNIQTGGYVGVNNFNITNLRIKARETDTFNGYAAPAMLKPITIDVVTGDSVTGHGDAVTFVRFGLGSLEISMNSMSLEVALGTSTTLDQVLGTANLGAMALYISPFSYVDIYTAAGVGVNMNFNVIVDQFSMSYISWGDTDGAGNAGIGVQIWMSPLATSAGYIGLENLVVGGPITITGTVRIDVNTSYAGIYAHGVVGTDPGAAPISVVHIGFSDNFNINVFGPITANVKLDGAAALNSANAKTLGDIYITGFNLDIINGSWVDIWAH